MSIKLTSKANTSPVSAQDPYGAIKDATLTSAGTPLTKAVHNDIHIFFERLKDIAGITDNGLLDNDTNGFQTYEALSKTIAVPLFYQLCQQAGVSITHSTIPTNEMIVFGYGLYNDRGILKSVKIDSTTYTDVIVYYQGEMFLLSQTNRVIGGIVTYTNNNGIRIINNLLPSVPSGFIALVQLPSNHTFTKTLTWSDVEEAGSWYDGSTIIHDSIDLKFYVKNGVCQVLGYLDYTDTGTGSGGNEILFNIKNIPKQKYSVDQYGITIYQDNSDVINSYLTSILTSTSPTQKLFTHGKDLLLTTERTRFNINFSYQVADDWYKDFHF